ncbi:MAG: S9 family peptidase [Bacteroidia bacterium]|nr:S9 family peptidase [Bacteroidia bacterium]MCO5253410.1 S9 family peptidase [Bacteroidota bacterium]
MNKTISKIILLFGIVLITFPQITQAQNLVLNDIWASSKYSPKGVSNFVAMQDGKRFVKLDDNEINTYDLKTGKKLATIVSKSDLKFKGKEITISSFDFSADETKVLIESDIQPIYRHSYEAKAYVLNLKTKEIKYVFGEPCRYPTFSPDGDKVAAVLHNNLIVENLSNGSVTAIGGDGKANEIIYGAVDWVYEEEFSMSRGFEWSPDGKRIAYLRFDERKVPEFTIELYNGDSYPKPETYKYPKAGEPNSIVSVNVYDLTALKSISIASTENDDSYLPRIQWANADILYFQQLNRHQNHLAIKRYIPSKDLTETVYEEDNKYYIDINDQYYFDKTGTRFVFLSERKGFNQIFEYNTQNKALTEITMPTYDVDAIKYFDSDKGVIYFTSAEETPSERQLYKIEISKKKKTKITNGAGWHNVTFTKGGHFFMEVFSTFSTPPIYLLKDNNGKLVRELENNEILSNKLKNEKFGSYSFGQLTTSNGDKLNYWQILPTDFDANKKYPVLFYVYGGPGSQTVKNQWGGSNYIWFQMLAQKGYIIMSVDNRGTGFRGEEFKKCTYLNLGKLEIEDQILSARWMAAQPYVDASRIGIWGWSYGGFMSSLGITLGSDIFKTAVAVAPVTNWKFYDNIYTERYMRTPIENKDGYEFNAPLAHVNKIKGKYLIIHGTADDNVHMQQSMEMVRLMVEKNIAFESEFYPNKNHGIYGGLTRLHLFNRITNFIVENL